MEKHKNTKSRKIVAIALSLSLIVLLTLVVAGIIIPEIFWGMVVIAWFIAYRYFPKSKKK